MINLYIVKGENFPDLLKSDLFVTCELSHSLTKIVQFAKTRSVKKSHNPVWDNDLQMPFTPPIFSTKNIECVFTIYDHENDSIGEFVIGFDITNEFEIGKLLPISFSCKNAKNNQQATLYIQFESNFSNLKEIEPFRFDKHAYMYCYYSHETFKEYGVTPDLSFLIISKDDPSFAKNFKEFNTNDISLNMNPICNKPTNTGKSQLLNFNVKKSTAIHKYIFVPILVSNGYTGNIYLNFAFITTKSKNTAEKPHLGAKYKMNICKERMISFPIAFTFDSESKLPLFYDVTSVNISDCSDNNNFILKVKNNALLAASNKFKSNLFSIKKIASLFKIAYPDVIGISFALTQKTDHSISAAAYTEDFALIGRVSSISNHSDLENALCYTYQGEEKAEFEFKRNEIFVNLKILNEKFDDVRFIIIVITSPSYEYLNGKNPTIQINDAESLFPLMTYQPKKVENYCSWMPIVLHKNDKGKFDIITMQKFFKSPKPFEAQIMMKNYLRNDDILNSYITK